MKRVAVTGLGCISALGNDVAAFWQGLLAGRTAFEYFDPDATAQRGYGFVRLNQLALEHLMGAR